jgi:DNA polymerase-1
MKRLLIDGDQFLFKSAAAVEKEIRWDEQNHVLYSNEVEAWALFEDMMERIKERFDTDRVILCTSSYPVWRTKLSPEYKAGRSRKPLCYALLLEKAEAKYTVQTAPGLEADDVMGILATKPSAGVVENIIVSQDKDMGTVPCTRWNGEHLITTTEAEADYFHLFQTLTGDKTDGYAGCPGVGPVKAEKILNVMPDGPIDPEITHVQWRWEQIVETFKKAGLTEEDALLNARLARILRWSDWDQEKKEAKLWTPTQ